MSLSRRLEAIVNQIMPARCLADVGTDHALVPLAALERGLVTEAIATDRCEAPLNHTRERLGASTPKGLSFLRGEGLTPLRASGCDAVIIAGMGARAIVNVLAETPEALSHCQQIILAPNQESWRIREWAFFHGWHLASESVIHEAGRDYPILDYRPGQGVDPCYDQLGWELEGLWRIGPLLLKTPTPEILAYFKRQLRHAERRGGPDAIQERHLWQRVLATQA